MPAFKQSKASSVSDPSTDMEAFKKVLKESKNIMVIAGAGLSAASGLPTFRGTGGYWRKFKSTSLATPEAFAENPSRVWQFYHYRREASVNFDYIGFHSLIKSFLSALRVEPNAAHFALARFTSPQVREAHCAPDSTFTLVTQNVDGLSPKALEEVSSFVTIPRPTKTQPHIIEMHGRIFDVLCTKCDHTSWNTTSPICPALKGTEKSLGPDDIENNIPEDQLPRCEACGALARPGVVWFGEQPHQLDVIGDLARKADLCIVIGTSATVYPAAGYAYEVRANGGKVAVFNMEETSHDKYADFLFLGPCEETIPATRLFPLH
ncbi:NAD-dependent protein deacylase [Leucoagaricus sp. SymC.cos]|nr:NAD-dependent protein deacylase [Leucoagaricus sp. SymC.cos]